MEDNSALFDRIDNRVKSVDDEKAEEEQKKKETIGAEFNKLPDHIKNRVLAFEVYSRASWTSAKTLKLDLSRFSSDEGFKITSKQLWIVINELVYNRWFKDKIKTLTLGQQWLDKLPVEIWELTGLQMFFLTGNKLKTLPDSVWKLTNLRYLDLENNLIVDKQKEIAKLPPQLKTIYF